MSKRKILVVDDDEGFLQMIQNYFKPQGYDIKIEANLEGAIMTFRQERPKVVLLDFNMPLMSGEQFLPLLQSMDPLVRAIVVTGCLEEEVEDKFKGLGYYAFFRKGDLSLEKLRQKVDEALSY